MVNVLQPWFERHPELLNREKEIMETLGFELDQKAFVVEKIVQFVGRSKVKPDYPIYFKYPSGYPSFPPSVISKVKPSLILNRHHSPDTGVLCCFGFANERWKANMTAYDVYLEAEQLILDYPPSGEPPPNDIVPEPRIIHYDYENGSLLIPPPFGDITMDDLKPFQKGQMKMTRNKLGLRGSLTFLSSKEHNHFAIDPYNEWFEKASVYNVNIRVLDESPPLDKEQLIHWLHEIGISVNTNKERWYIFVFPDEWGKRGVYRPTWILLHVFKGICKWIKCYTVTSDDQTTRTPHAKLLKSKNVLLVGAGSLGSAVAVNLAQEGLGNVILVDNDLFEPGNSVRHQAIQRSFGVPKVYALEQRIKQVAPVTNVTPLFLRVGGHLNTKDYENFIQALLQADVVVDTTGQHSVTHYLNSLCTSLKKKFIVGSVTNGAWSAEVVRYLPDQSGCWGCWNLSYADTPPPGAPQSSLQFAPGCNQPTFVGAVSDTNIASGLIAQFVVDTLVNETKHNPQIGGDYLMWTSRNMQGNWNYNLKILPNSVHPSCLICN